MIKIGTIIIYDDGITRQKMVVIGFNNSFVKVYNISSEHNEIINRERLSNTSEFIIQGDY